MEVKGTLRYSVVASALAAVATSPPRKRVREAAKGRMRVVLSVRLDSCRVSGVVLRLSEWEGVLVRDCR